MEDKSADYGYMPLRTRYQPQGCWPNANEVLPERCTVPMNETRFKAFNFVWRNDTWLEKLKQYQLDLGFNLEFEGLEVGRTTEKRVNEYEMRAHGGIGLDVDSSKRMKGISDESKICLVGYSHSYHLIYAFWANKLGHRFIWAQAKYPSDPPLNSLSSTIILAIVLRSLLVLGNGQRLSEGEVLILSSNGEMK